LIQDELRTRKDRIKTSTILIRLLRRLSATDFFNTIGHSQPSCSVAVDGGLSPDSCRAGRMPMTEESGQKAKEPVRRLGAATALNGTCVSRRTFDDDIVTQACPRRWATTGMRLRSTGVVLLGII
jgi:hypothetical protein